MILKFKGAPMHLIAPPIKVGDKLDFKATNNNFSDFELSKIENKKKLISVVPSIDTNTCLLQTKHMNEEIKKLGNIQLITISRDLPFASQRVCATFKDEHHILISDFKYQDFGTKTGLVIKELGLLARALILLSEDNIVEYIAINDEVSQEPDYNKLWKFINNH